MSTNPRTLIRINFHFGLYNKFVEFSVWTGIRDTIKKMWSQGSCAYTYVLRYILIVIHTCIYTYIFMIHWLHYVIDYIMSHIQFYYMQTCIHTYTNKHTFKKNHAITLSGGRTRLGLGTPFLFWGPRFFKPMGSQDPIFFIPSANTDVNVLLLSLQLNWYLWFGVSYSLL